jgi:hypothetical protein
MKNSSHFSINYSSLISALTLCRLLPNPPHSLPLYLYVGHIQTNFLSIVDFYSDITLILTTIAVKQCMDIGARPHVCRVLFMFLIFVLTLADGLRCTWFIYPILCWC